MTKPWPRDEDVPDEHKEARYVRDRALAQKLNCPNCGTLVLLGVEQYIVERDKEWEDQLIRLCDLGALVLMPIEEAEQQGREVGCRPSQREDGD